MSDYIWKVSPKRLADLVKQGLITQEQSEALSARTAEKEPRKHQVLPEGEYLIQPRFYLNKAHSVWVQPIHFYGGEHFGAGIEGKPYAWDAEICHTTTNACFARFKNLHNLNDLPCFTY